MRAIVPMLLAAGALAACEKEPEMSNKAATEVVERVNSPTIMIQPQPILEHEINRLRFRSAGCIFSPGSGGHGAMVLAMQEAGYMKFGDEIVRFAADSGSADLKDGVRERYFGTSHWFRIAFTEADRAHLTVGDHADHIVFEADGKIWCDT